MEITEEEINFLLCCVGMADSEFGCLNKDRKLLLKGILDRNPQLKEEHEWLLTN